MHLGAAGLAAFSFVAIISVSSNLGYLLPAIIGLESMGIPSPGETALVAAAIAAGGQDNGAPGERPYHPGYYAAFARDPDGNNVEVVHHGPATRSAPSVVITF